jgi:hypothetical protein
MMKVYLCIGIFLAILTSCKEAEVVATKSKPVENVNTKKVDDLIPDSHNGAPQLIENEMENRKPIKPITPKK